SQGWRYRASRGPAKARRELAAEGNKARRRTGDAADGQVTRREDQAAGSLGEGRRPVGSERQGRSQERTRQARRRCCYSRIEELLAYRALQRPAVPSVK